MQYNFEFVHAKSLLVYTLREIVLFNIDVSKYALKVERLIKDMSNQVYNNIYDKAKYSYE